jgi:zinc transport system permease protein
LLDILLSKLFIVSLIISLICCFLGVVILWKKLAFFGDGLSHSMLLIFVFLSYLQIPLTNQFSEEIQILSAIIFAIIFALIYELISLNKIFSKNTIIAIIAYFCMALSSFFNISSFDHEELEKLIFGDISQVSEIHLFVLIALLVIIIIYSFFSYKKHLLIAISEDLAKIDNIAVAKTNFLFTALLAITIAICAKLIGVFLITSLLILPAATARIYANNSKNMFLLSAIFSIFAVLIAFFLTNISPKFSNQKIEEMIIITLSFLFFTSLIFYQKISKKYD